MKGVASVDVTGCRSRGPSLQLGVQRIRGMNVEAEREAQANAMMGIFGAFNYGLHLFGGYLGGRSQ